MCFIQLLDGMRSFVHLSEPFFEKCLCSAIYRQVFLGSECVVLCIYAAASTACCLNLQFTHDPRSPPASVFQYSQVLCVAVYTAALPDHELCYDTSSCDARHGSKHQFCNPEPLPSLMCALWIMATQALLQSGLLSE